MHHQLTHIHLPIGCGKVVAHNYKTRFGLVKRLIPFTDVMLVVSSMTDDGISNSSRLGIVPFGDGKCILQHTAYGSARLIAHYFGGNTSEVETACINDQLELSLIEYRNGEILEWLEVIFE